MKGRLRFSPLNQGPLGFLCSLHPAFTMPMNFTLPRPSPPRKCSRAPAGRAGPGRWASGEGGGASAGMHRCDWGVLAAQGAPPRATHTQIPRARSPPPRPADRSPLRPQDRASEAHLAGSRGVGEPAEEPRVLLTARLPATRSRVFIIGLALESSHPLTPVTCSVSRVCSWDISPCVRG